MPAIHSMMRNTPEWERAWSVVFNTKFRTKPPGPVDSHEHWQYMGTVQIDGSWVHQFRHRYHPATGQCERINVRCPDPSTIIQLET